MISKKFLSASLSLILAVSTLFLTSIPAFAQENSVGFDDQKMEKYLTVKAALLGIASNMSLYFQDLNHNAEIAIDPTRSWIPASTIKAFIVPEVFRQRQLGLINFNQPVTIKAENVVSTAIETDEFPTLREGTVVTVRQLLEMMVTQSDNTAYNTLLDILDRRNVNATLRQLGMTETVVGEKLNLDENQFQTDINAPGRQPNTTTVKDFATLFSLLYDKQISNSDEILAIFKRQKLNDMIPLLLPKDVAIAHKTGVWNPIFHDGGIIYKENAPFILTIFTNSNDPEAVAEMSKVAYYQTSDSVVNSENTNQPQSLNPSTSFPHKIYLAASNLQNQVLGVQAASVLNATYEVKSGDTLWSIADRFYHDGSRYTEILSRNPQIDPNNLRTGTNIIIPNIPSNSPPQGGKFPEVTASDLGITKSDLAIDKPDTQNIQPALITPHSPLYPLKTSWQNLLLSLSGSDQNRADALLALSQSRLAEAKTLLASSDFAAINQLFNQSQSYLLQAADLSKKSPNGNETLFKISQINDAHFALLATAPSQVSKDKQEQLIDVVYSQYQKQKEQIFPEIASIKAVNPLQQSPIIGTVTKTQGNEVTIKFDDGHSQSVSVSSLTPVRDFTDKKLESPSSLTPGFKIAIIGQTGPNGKIIPQFILNHLPPELPSKHQGIVTKVDPANKMLEIQEANGKTDEVTTNDQTTIKAKDTQVSLPGIRVGSNVTVFGQSEGSASATITPMPSITMTPSATPKTKTNEKPAPSTNTGTNSQNTTPPTTIKATSITVTTNGSGKNEKEVKKEESKPSDQKQKK